MRRLVPGLVSVLGLFALLATPCRAHHRQTDPIVQFTTDGDNFWPAVPSTSERLVFAKDTATGRQIFLRQRDRVTFLPITDGVGDHNDNPVVSARGNVIAWESDGDLLDNGSTGIQVYLLRKGVQLQPAIDPTGTSSHPTVNALGSRLAFDSTGDLAGIANGGKRQVYVYDTRKATLTQASFGQGSSANASYGRGSSRLAFESTTDPDTGTDSGVSQVWLQVRRDPAFRLTDGAGPSTLPAMSPRGRLVTFQSTAALATDGHDTGVNQIFVYDLSAKFFRRLTNDPGGCQDPSVNDQSRAWRVVYMCGTQAYYTDIRTDEQFLLPPVNGETVEALAEGGAYFVLISAGSPGKHDLFQLNLYKLAGSPVAVGGIVSWQ
jgi:Tol biopolymer transport system component